MSNSSEAVSFAELQKGCHAYIDGQDTVYGYVPTLSVGIAFCVLFGLPFLYHAFQSVRLRAATSILLALGAMTEVVGWAARTYNAKCPYNRDAFLAQTCTLILAPVFFSAALYVALGKLIIDLGPGSSAISARWYAIVFCTFDVVSLIVQAVGGAKASMADTDNDQLLGTHIMIAGIAFQLFTMTLFGGLAADFVRRVVSRRRAFRQQLVESGRMRLVLVAMAVSFVVIYVRSIYRTIELAEGWTGYLITHEGYFIALDAAVMVVAVGVFVGPFDPALMFRARYGKALRVKRAGMWDSETGIAMEHKK